MYVPRYTKSDSQHERDEIVEELVMLFIFIVCYYLKGQGIDFFNENPGGIFAGTHTCGPPKDTQWSGYIAEGPAWVYSSGLNNIQINEDRKAIRKLLGLSALVSFSAAEWARVDKFVIASPKNMNNVLCPVCV